jgi:signal recognition particle subunit SRP19
VKDYDHFIIWLDYFNKNLSRRKGRRIQKEHAIFDPTISELLQAVLDSGLNITNDKSNDHARYPRRSFVRSGYVMIPKINKKKYEIMQMLASKISSRRKMKRN